MGKDEINKLLKERGDRIKGLLEEKEVTQAMIADELGVKPPTVSQVINRGFTSRPIQSLICKKLGKTFDEIWG